MHDDRTTLSELKQKVRTFSQSRNWEQFHHPKDLALALVCEIGEVLDHFRYQTNEEIAVKLTKPIALTELSHELADCLWLLLRLADVTSIDLSAALQEKLVLADRKYPIEKAYGRPNKYTDYIDPKPQSDMNPTHTE